MTHTDAASKNAVHTAWTTGAARPEHAAACEDDAAGWEHQLLGAGVTHTDAASKNAVDTAWTTGAASKNAVHTAWTTGAASKNAVETAWTTGAARTEHAAACEDDANGQKFKVRYNDYVQEVRFKLLKPEITQQWETMACQLLRRHRNAVFYTWTELTELWVYLNNKYMWDPALRM